MFPFHSHFVPNEQGLPLVQPRGEPRFHGQVRALINRHSHANATSVAAEDLVLKEALSRIRQR